MVVVDPCGDVGVAVKLEGFAGFPSGIEDTEIDVGTDGGLARTAGEPRLHIAGGTDWAFFVEDRNNGEGGFKAEGFPEGLDYFGHGWGVGDTATHLCPGEHVGWGYGFAAGGGSRCDG